MEVQKERRLSPTQYWLALSSAAEEGDAASLEELLQEDRVDVSMYKEAMLRLAAHNGHEDVVRLLLADERVNVNAKDGHGRTTLSLAASDGHEAVVRLRLESDRVDVNEVCYGTPLSAAASNGHEAVVRLLLANDRVDVNEGYWRGGTPLCLAASNGHEAVVRLLLESDRVNVNAGYWYGGAPLSAAASNGHEAVVRLLLANDRVDVNDGGLYKETPLLEAVSNGHEAVVALLLSRHDVDVNAKEKKHYYGIDFDFVFPYRRNTALSIAVKKGHTHIVQRLRADHRVDVDGFEFERMVRVLFADARALTSTSLPTAATLTNTTVFTLLLEKCVELASAWSPTLRQRLIATADAAFYRPSPDPRSLFIEPTPRETVTVTLPRNRMKSPFDNSPPEVPMFFAFILHIIQCLLLLARRLQARLQYGLLTSFDDLSVFPNRRRPPCTTMPWSIWPALVVLWGVCWMFYCSPSTSQPDESSVTLQNGLLGSYSDYPLHGKTSA
jgi:ankyrin repeat protein